MGSSKAARNKTMKNEKKQKELIEEVEKPNEVEEKRSVSTVMKKKKRRREEEKDAVKMSSEDNIVEAKTEKKKNKSSREKKRKGEERNDGKSNQLGDDVEDGFQGDNAEQDQSATQGKIDSSKEAGKLKRSGKKGKDLITSKKGKKSSEKRPQGPQTDISLGKDEEVEADDVYHISSGDDDCSKGMKKWIVNYHQSRPGLKILQERIDDFITAHEAQLEQERKEREARAAEGGWTVVVHHKGRKKTTDSESGITVGSVAQAVVEDKMTKKKHKEVGLDFYRFQKREAQRNEIMMLQSKFEQDKKRIQQLRAARKFRPY